MTEKCFQRFIIYYLDAEAHLSGRNRASDALQLLWDHTELLPEHIHKAQNWLPEIKEQAELIWSLPLLACLMMYWKISLTSALCGQLASSITHSGFIAVVYVCLWSRQWKLKMHLSAFVPLLPHVHFGFMCSLQKWVHRTRLTTLWLRLLHCQTFNVSKIWSDLMGLKRKLKSPPNQEFCFLTFIALCQVFVCNSFQCQHTSDTN